MSVPPSPSRDLTPRDLPSTETPETAPRRARRKLRGPKFRVPRLGKLSLAELRGAATTLLALSSVGCFGTPTPLAPNLEGSIGVPHSGVLTNAVELPVRGPGFERYRPTSPVYWGHPRLVAAIQRAAQAVAEKRPGGAPLVIGDLSARTGGKIPRHNSHRTGRDIDLLFYVTSPTGVPVRNPGFIPFGADGLSQLEDGRVLRLDVERQWLFLRELLTDPEINVQFLFVSRDLEALIIEYALARETDLALVWHAQTVMIQPVDSLPHNDHIHMRIACGAEDAVKGCLGGGPRWEWLEPLPRLEGPLEELLAAVAQDDPLTEEAERIADVDETSVTSEPDAPARAPTGPVSVAPQGS